MNYVTGFFHFGMRLILFHVIIAYAINIVKCAKCLLKFRNKSLKSFFDVQPNIISKDYRNSIERGLHVPLVKVRGTQPSINILIRNLKEEVVHVIFPRN